MADIDRTWYAAYLDDSGAGNDGTPFDLSEIENWNDAIDDALANLVRSQTITFTEDATHTTHTGTVTLPAGSTLHNIEIVNSVLWTPTGAATLKVGDGADDDGWFTGVNMKATDLLVGEVLSLDPNNWGGKNGAYLVAATGRRGPAATNFGCYYAAGGAVIAVITVGTPAAAVGRTFMTVTYSIGTVTAATAV